METNTSSDTEFWGALLAGLIGALGAIVGVVIQRWFEKRDRASEESRQIDAIGKALISEIDAIRGYYLTPLQAALANPEIGGEHRVPLKSPPGSPFPIYRANAHRIGEFSVEQVDSLTKFYTHAEDFIVTLKDAVRAQQNLAMAGDIQRAQGAARALFHQLREMIPQILPLANTAIDSLTPLEEGN